MIFHIQGFSHNRGLPYYNSSAIFNKGEEAVYMFFTLSGFLIIRGLFIEKLGTGTISIKSFYERRIRRIFPLYYLVLFAGITYYYYVLPMLNLAARPSNCSISDVLVLGGTFFANILAKMHPGGILEILWSLSIEEQFYILIAPAIFLLPIKRIKIFLLIFSVIYFALLNYKAIPFLSRYNMYFYFFSLGGFFSICKVCSPASSLPNWLRHVVYATVLAYFFTNFLKEHTSPPYYHLFSAILFSVFIWSFCDRPLVFFQNSILKYLGKISYGIYMLHAIALQATGLLFLNIGHLLNDFSFIVAFNLSTIMLTIILAHYSYQYFESFFFKPRSFLVINTKKKV